MRNVLIQFYLFGYAYIRYKSLDFKIYKVYNDI